MGSVRVTMRLYKQPVSVLVVIYTLAPLHSRFGLSSESLALPNSELTESLNVLLLERVDCPDFWQSVTGSQESDESLLQTAAREVAEETGLDVIQHELTDWHQHNIYEIYPRWRHRYAPNITHNTEHVFGLELFEPVSVKLSPNEHLNQQWLPWQDAAKKVFSPSNRAAILWLAEQQLSSAPSK